jgi:hypothetical protein
MQFDTKIAVVLRDDLAVWQKTKTAVPSVRIGE